MDLGFDVVVTITGIVLVFLILVLLMAIITLEGKIFDSMNAKKKAAKTAAQAPAAKSGDRGKTEAAKPKCGSAVCVYPKGSRMSHLR